MSYHKKIIYQKDAKFNIVPHVCDAIICDFQLYIDKVKSDYVTLAGTTHSFFWRFDKYSQSIVVDETATAVSIDFRDQLIKLACWLFDREFRLEGSFYFRGFDSIEYLVINKSDRLIKNYILVEKIDVSGFSYGYVDDLQIETKIMDDAREKMYSYIKKSDDTTIAIDAVNTDINDTINYQIKKIMQMLYRLEKKTNRLINIVGCVSVVAMYSFCMYQIFCLM